MICYILLIISSCELIVLYVARQLLYEVVNKFIHKALHLFIALTHNIVREQFTHFHKLLTKVHERDGSILAKVPLFLTIHALYIHMYVRTKIL